MKLPFDLTEEIIIDITEKYNFNKESLEKIGQNKWVKGQWPLVYFISSQFEQTMVIKQFYWKNKPIMNLIYNKLKNIEINYSNFYSILLLKN